VISGTRALLANRVPMWVRQTAILIGIYVALMYVLTSWMPMWHDWDWRFFQGVSAKHTPTISSKISLIDVRSWDPGNRPADRRTVGRFLHQLVASKQHPKVVILDIEFGPCQSNPCGDPTWNSARTALEEGLAEAAHAGINVYAAEGIQPGRAGQDEASGVDPHDPDIYTLLAGAAQTHVTPVPGSSGLFYRVCYEVPRTDQNGTPISGATEAVWAMPWRVMPDFDVTQACDTEHLPLFKGATIAPLDRTGRANLAPPNYSITNTNPFPSGPGVLKDQYIVVGTVQYDRPKDSDRSGPELVAWELSDVLEGEGPRNTLQAHYEARPQNGMLLVFVPAFSALMALTFTAWFFLLRRLQLRGTRRFLPWVAAVLALAVALVVFATFEAWMLAENWIQPQVTLISLGMVLAAALCGVRGNQIEFQQLYNLDPMPVEKHDYDVFISYAHDEGAWVYEHVYAPFRDAKLPSGQKLSIFFDTTEIRGGTDWQSKISLAIEGSRFIVPVYSDIYFQRPYCRFEISRAHRKWINAGEESRCVLPVMRGHPKILVSVDDIQGISVDDQSDIVEQYVLEIVTRLSRAASPGGQAIAHADRRNSEAGDTPGANRGEAGPSEVQT
jgi:hypothetical protein